MYLQRWWRNSLRRPLVLLVALEAGTACLLLAVTLLAFHEFDHHLQFLQRFTVAPVVGIERTLRSATQLSNLAETAPDIAVFKANSDGFLDDVDDFLHRYRAEWQVVDSTSDDALRVQRKLIQAGRRRLLVDERSAIARLDEGIEALGADLASRFPGPLPVSISEDTAQIDRGLRELLSINVAHIEMAHGCVQDRVRQRMLSVALLGALAIVGATTIGILVRRAIAPRVRHLVECVRGFQREGVYEPIADPGDDDLTVLAHALDSGFASLAAHERSRERFLSVVAHELKTPVTSIQGFSEVARQLPADDPRLVRAIEIVHRNARRLGHLIEDILLAARTRTRDLPFEPRPTDLAAIARRSVAEVQAALPSHPFVVKIPDHVCVLGDDKLLSHAVWSLLTSAAHVSAEGAPVEIEVRESQSRPQLEIRLPHPAVPPEELESAMTPFGAVGYEHCGFRNAVGLALCREIARLHGGSLRIQAPRGAPATLTMELRA